MKVFIDAPLLIYLNTMADSRERIPYENFYIEILTRYKAYTDIIVLDEVIYISWRKYRVPYRVSIEFIRSNVLPYVSILSLGEDEFEHAAKTMLEHELKPSAALHIAAMANNGIHLIASEDKEYDKIPAVKRLWIE